jgi:hypothetical protein
MLMFPILTRRLDGPPSGHAHLGRGFPRLKEDALEGVLAVKVIAASLGLEVVNQEAPEDVKGLAAVGEAARVIAMEVRGVVVLFEDGFSKEDERPSDVEAIGRPPFVPYSVEGFPSLLSQSAIHETVLGGLRESLITSLAIGRDTDGLEPGSDR